MARLQIQVSDELDTRLKAYANRIGVPKNAMCAVLLYQCLERKAFEEEMANENDYADEYYEHEEKRINEALLRVIRENGIGKLIDEAFREELKEKGVVDG